MSQTTAAQNQDGPALAETAENTGTALAAEPAPPAESVAPAAVETSADASGPRAEPSVRRQDIARILKIEVPIIVRLAQKTLPLSEILRLSPGTIIEFDKTIEEGLDLMINNKRIGSGVAVKVGENFGLRVSKIGPVEQTIKAMGA